MVREPDSQDDIWWATRDNGSPNYEMDERTFLLNRERAVDYLNMLDRLYVFDGYAGWDPAVRPRLSEKALCCRLVAALQHTMWECTPILTHPQEF